MHLYYFPMKNLLIILAFAFHIPSFADQVIGIADGDTLTVLHDRKPLKIRLANIDAPEKMQPFGAHSKQSLSDLCYRRDATYDIQTIDRYGRTVAVVTCSGVNVNRAQVERGLAWVYGSYNRDATLHAVESRAKAAKRGLWSDATPTPPWEFRHPIKKVAKNDSECHIGPRGGRYRLVNGHKRYGC